MVELLHHHVVSKDQYPPVELLEPYIDRKTDAHWYWEGDIREDPFSRTPVFHWRPGSDGARGMYVVARLLWAAANDGAHKRRNLVNTCGVYACVNPAHWVDADVKRYTLPVGVNAQLLDRLADKLEIEIGMWGEREVQSHDRVHVVHIVSEKARYTVCGMLSRGGVVPQERVAITCVNCLRDWKALGRPLEELP